MGRIKIDKRRTVSKTRLQKQCRTTYNDYKNDPVIKRVIQRMQKGYSIRQTAAFLNIPKSTVGNIWKRFSASTNKDLVNFAENHTNRNTALNDEEEQAVEKYVLWQYERGFCLQNHEIKALIREIHAKAVAKGEKRQKINPVDGPSDKFMRGFYERRPDLRPRLAEHVDRGRINMANSDTIKQYFDLLKDTLIQLEIAQVDANGDIMNDNSFKRECIYKADETGWGVQSKKRVIAKKGAKHVYMRKLNDESHKTLMLGICANGETLTPLIILEKSFPLIAGGEAEMIPDDLLLTKSDKGSMDKPLFTEWLEKAVVPHKKKVNPNGPSLLLVDNHISRMSIAAIDLCESHNIDMLSYPGHLTHILQGPDVTLNKPISRIVDKMIHSKATISGTTDITRLAMMSIITHAVGEVCTEEHVKAAFESTGVVPFNPNKVDLSNYPTSLPSAPVPISESPVKATCSACRVENVELHPLVRQGVIPKHLAEVFVYTPPPAMTKSKSRVVKFARIITSEEVKNEIREIERKKIAKGKMPRIVLSGRSRKNKPVSKGGCFIFLAYGCSGF